MSENSIDIAFKAAIRAKIVAKYDKTKFEQIQTECINEVINTYLGAELPIETSTESTETGVEVTEIADKKCDEMPHEQDNLEKLAEVQKEISESVAEAREILTQIAKIGQAAGSVVQEPRILAQMGANPAELYENKCGARFVSNAGIDAAMLDAWISSSKKIPRHISKNSPMINTQQIVDPSKDTILGELHKHDAMLDCGIMGLEHVEQKLNSGELVPRSDEEVRTLLENNELFKTASDLDYRRKRLGAYDSNRFHFNGGQ